MKKILSLLFDFVIGVKQTSWIVYKVPLRTVSYSVNAKIVFQFNLLTFLTLLQIHIESNFLVDRLPSQFGSRNQAAHLKVSQVENLTQKFFYKINFSAKYFLLFVPLHPSLNYLHYLFRERNMRRRSDSRIDDGGQDLREWKTETEEEVRHSSGMAKGWRR